LYLSDNKHHIRRLLEKKVKREESSSLWLECRWHIKHSAIRWCCAI